MIEHMTDEEVVAERNRQASVVADALRKVLLRYPGTDTLALIQMVELCGGHSTLLRPNDLNDLALAAKL